MKVLIIGGGLGGLCLANGLQKESIEARVFERGLTPHSENEGYFIHLEGPGQRALKRCMSEKGWDDFLNVSTPTGAQWAFRDPQLQLIAMRDDCEITGKPLDVIERRAIERWELRGVLLRALGPKASTIVQWGKTFTHYEEIESGRVRAFFADGSTEDGDVLIGADGSKSKVREQRLPQVCREDLGIVTICGKYFLTDENSGDLPELMKDNSLNNIVPYGRGWLFLSSWRSRVSQQDGDQADARPYSLWAYFVPKDSTPSNMPDRGAEALRDIVIEGVRGWSPPIEKVVKEADLSTIIPIYLRCASHLEHWNPSRISMIGDAIHNMTPAAGVGANTALRDAELLTNLLAQSVRAGTDVVEALGNYEAQMRPYANAAVALSRQIAEGAASTSLVQRLMFRALLAAASLSPMVMKATIGRGAIESYRETQVGNIFA